MVSLETKGYDETMKLYFEDIVGTDLVPKSRTPTLDTREIKKLDLSLIPQGRLKRGISAPHIGGGIASPIKPTHWLPLRGVANF